MAPERSFAHPQIVDRVTWESARAQILGLEKEATKAADRASAARRRLPMTPVADYIFDGPSGTVNLLDLFDGRSQLIVQHFMFDPSWDAGCPSCSNLADNLPHLAHFAPYDIAFARVSRASIDKIVAYNERMGWQAPWVSSFNNSFNADFGWTGPTGESPGISVYLRVVDRIYQTYRTDGRGVEILSGLAGYLDISPYGRQEDWEDSPAGWPQLAVQEDRRHDEY